MNKRIVFRNMDHSTPMEDHANQQLVKIEQFLETVGQPITIELYLEPSKVHEHHRVELHVRCGHYNLHSSYEHEGMNFYDVLDRVIDVMYKNLHEEKRKYNDQKESAGREDKLRNNSDTEI